MKKVGVFPNPKSPNAEFGVSVDLVEWLGEDTISSITLSARDEDGNIVTDDILDDTKSKYLNCVVYPYVKGGINGLIYNIDIDVDTSNGDHGTFYLQFRCARQGL
jgi:hypothetical protein